MGSFIKPLPKTGAVRLYPSNSNQAQQSCQALGFQRFQQLCLISYYIKKTSDKW